MPKNTKTVTITRSLNLPITLVNPVSGIVNYSNDTNSGVGFKLSSLPGYSEFTTLFDQFRIKQVRMTWRPRYNQAPMTVNPDATCPKLVVVPDYNDASLLNNINQYLQYEEASMELLDHPITRVFRPRPSMAVYNNVVTTGYALPDTAPWIDTQSSGVEHYACKWAFTWPLVGTGTPLATVDLEIQYTIELRGVN